MTAPISQETSLTVVYNDHFYTTLLVAPEDLEDFAVGFSLSEGVITHKSQVVGFDVGEKEVGLILNVKLEDGIGPPAGPRTHTQGHVKCFCMLARRSSFRCESTTVRKIAIAQADLARALDAVAAARPRALFWRSGQGVCVTREDDDRVNALDKLVGAIVTADIGLDRGFVAVSGTASVDLVNKAGTAGVIAMAVGTMPKAPAINAAKQMNLALVTSSDGVARVLCGMERIDLRAARTMPAA